MSLQITLDHLNKISDNNSSLFFILGPCAIENELHSLKVAEYLKKLSEKLNFKLIFKSSFDKANRTSVNGYRSVGLKEGSRILRKIKEELDLPICTDVHESWQAQEVAAFADILQIPAFLCRQTDLLLSVGETDKIINIKKGQFVAPHVVQKSAEKVASIRGNEKIWLCERGYAFGYEDLIVDFRNFPLMKAFGYPVVFDATHSVQKPSGLGACTGGDRKMVSSLAVSAVSNGIAGIFMEVHEEPEKALCDGPNSIRLSQLEDFLKYLIELDDWIKSRKQPEVF